MTIILLLVGVASSEILNNIFSLCPHNYIAESSQASWLLTYIYLLISIRNKEAFILGQCYGGTLQHRSHLLSLLTFALSFISGGTRTLVVLKYLNYTSARLDEVELLFGASTLIHHGPYRCRKTTYRFLWNNIVYLFVLHIWSGSRVNQLLLRPSTSTQSGNLPLTRFGLALKYLNLCTLNNLIVAHG